MGNNSPVYDAIKNIVNLFGVDEKASVFSYKNVDHFKELWKLLATSSPQVDKLSKTFVIVWDGIPARGNQNDFVNTSKYLTPIDWAIGCSLSIGRKYKGQQYPDFKILILDLNSSMSDSDGLRFIGQFPNQSTKNIPWIRIFTPLESSQWGLEGFFLGIINSEGNDIKIPTIKDVFEKEAPDLDIIKNIWAAFLTRPSKPGDHHALANIIGPQMLLEDKADLHVMALRSLMKEIGLLPKEEKAESLLNSNRPWINWQESRWNEKLNNILRPETKLNLVLVDDMFNIGWGKMLCWAVGANYEYANTASSDKTKPIQIGSTNDKKIVVYAASSAQFLIDKLKDFKKAGTMDQRFKFSLIDEEVAKNSLEILFLDLRLFTEKDIGVKEGEFYKELLSIAEEFEQSKDSNLPWDGFKKEDEINKVKTWLDSEDKKREVDEHITALTFLPRILALTDLSLPIILFSSTGRRDIVKKLENYGNIITDFDKPKFTVDIPLDIAEQTKGKFHEAVGEAIKLLKARQKCRFINKNRDSFIQSKKYSKGVHIELFIDESFPDSQNQVYVGGCFALFSAETKKKAQERADYFDNDLVTNGVRFFQSFGIGAQASQLKEKKEDVSGELLQTVKTSSHEPHYLGLIRLGYQLPAKHSAFDLFNPHSADNLYRLTLIALVEIFLSETLPALLGADIAENASVSIFAGTRVKDYNDDEDGKAALNQAKYHLGLESFEEKDRHGQISKHLLYSISRDSIYPIVAHILSANKLSRHIERTVGIKLAYEKSKGNSPRFPSYFVCRKCKEIQSIDANKDIVEKNDSISNVAVVADIKLDRNNQKYGVVRPVENSGSCIVFKNEWSDIDNAKKNDLILFSQLIQDSKGRMQAKGVRLLTNDERELYEKAEKKYSLSDSVNMRCSCGSQGSFSPDYRALHYIADEVLNKIGMIKGGTGLGQAIKFAPGVFDDILNDDLQATIIACRYLNLGDIVSAIVEIKLANQGGLGKYRVKPKVLNRMACHLDNLSGEDFMRVAERISEV